MSTADADALARLIALVRDLAENGCRVDTHPTLYGDPGDLGRCLELLRAADQSVRQRAREAIERWDEWRPGK
jgi:hypothetical protein